VLIVGGDRTAARRAWTEALEILRSIGSPEVTRLQRRLLE
jgi:hypothetical protein